MPTMEKKGSSLSRIQATTTLSSRLIIFRIPYNTYTSIRIKSIYTCHIIPLWKSSMTHNIQRSKANAPISLTMRKLGRELNELE